MLFSLSKSFELLDSEKKINIGYYNMVKLFQPDSRLYLASTNRNYDTGSTQQIVRAIENGALAETFWTIYPLMNESAFEQGKQIECGHPIRLKHAVTGAFLHSHQVNSKYHDGYEVSAFDGNDSGDFWRIDCDKTWNTKQLVYFEHVDTHHYLSVNTSQLYPDFLGGQYEVYTSSDPEYSEWVVSGGIFVDL